MLESESLARAAGDVLLDFYGRISHETATRKGGRRRDLVSEADVAAEALILDRIPSGEAVLAEESGTRPGNAARSWLVDPLDGTVNFLHGLPFWAVSIAAFEDGEPVEAAVHAPVLGWTFTATQGGGCMLNGVQQRVSTTGELGDAILATGFPYRRDELPDHNLDNVPRIGPLAGGLRRMGSAALDLAMTAAGKLDGYWELHLEAWDVAAGILLVREAGGRVTDFRGATGTLAIAHGRHIVASNGHIHEALRAGLGPLREL